MVNWLLQFVNKYVLWGIVIFALSLVSGAFVNLIDWSFLVGFFSIIINFLNLFNFTFNIPLLLVLTGIVFVMESAMWLFLGTYWLVRFFKGN